MTVRRYILALTDGEIGQLRAALQVQLDNGEFDQAPPAERAAAKRAIAKIDEARAVGLVSSEDIRALDHAAGNLLDTDPREYESFRRQCGVRGNAYRARDLLRKVFQ